MSDYSTYDNVLFCLNTQVDQPGRFWEGAIGSSSLAVPTEFARFVEMGIPNRSWRSADTGADNRRPQVVTGGGLLFGTHNGAISRFMFFIDPLTGANDPCEVVHQNGIFDLWISFQTNASMGSGIGCLLDATNLSTTDLGFYLVVSSGKLIWGVNNGTATPALTMSSVEDVNDNTRHTAHIHMDIGAGACSMRVDKSTRVYATQGTRSSGNIMYPPAFGGRVGAQTANDFEGTIWGCVGSIGPISEAQKAEFLADNPYGNIAGFPEIRVGNIHFNLYNTYYYVPTQVYAFGKRVSDPTDADGCVYAWNNSSGWQGSGHGAGAPPEGGETVISKQASIDGGEWFDIEDGDDLEGDIVSVRRNTSTVAFSSQLHTMTTYGDSRIDNIILTRNSTAGSGGTPGILTMYPIRNSRDVSFTQYRAYDVNGDYISGGTLTTSSGITALPAGTKHFTQWSSSLEILSVVTMRKGHLTTGFRHIIIGVPQNMRHYQEIQNFPTNVGDTAGTTFEMESLTTFYQSTAGTWEANSDSYIKAALLKNSHRGITLSNLRLGL